MKRKLGGKSSAVPGSPSAPSTNGSSPCSGMNTEPLLPLLIRSRPWSKNWPKNVIHALNGAERPSSGAMFGIEARSALVRYTPLVPRGCPGATGTMPGLASSHAATARGLLNQADTAAGLLILISEIRFEMMRGSASATLPV
ncbi:hypothetical protein D3C71_1187060 [compost metagenome]